MKPDATKLAYIFTRAVTELGNDNFSVSRDIVIADLIPIILKFPSINNQTGYPIVPLNTFSRLAGLIYCHHQISGMNELDLQILKLDRAIQTLDSAQIEEDIFFPRWMFRHAQTSLVSVKNTITDPLFKEILKISSLSDAQKVIMDVENIHMPKLLELMGDEAPDRRFIQRLLIPRIPAPC
jgi:hypothetical protein